MGVLFLGGRGGVFLSSVCVVMFSMFACVIWLVIVFCVGCVFKCVVWFVTMSCVMRYVALWHSDTLSVVCVCVCVHMGEDMACCCVILFMCYSMSLWLWMLQCVWCSVLLCVYVAQYVLQCVCLCWRYSMSCVALIAFFDSHSAVLVVLDVDGLQVLLLLLLLLFTLVSLFFLLFVKHLTAFLSFFFNIWFIVVYWKPNFLSLSLSCFKVNASWLNKLSKHSMQCFADIQCGGDSVCVCLHVCACMHVKWQALFIFPLSILTGLRKLNSEESLDNMIWISLNCHIPSHTHVCNTSGCTHTHTRTHTHTWTYMQEGIN